MDRLPAHGAGRHVRAPLGSDILRHHKRLAVVAAGKRVGLLHQRRAAHEPLRLRVHLQPGPDHDLRLGKIDAVDGQVLAETLEDLEWQVPRLAPA